MWLANLLALAVELGRAIAIVIISIPFLLLVSSELDKKNPTDTKRSASRLEVGDTSESSENGE